MTEIAALLDADYFLIVGLLTVVWRLFVISSQASKTTQLPAIWTRLESLSERLTVLEHQAGTFKELLSVESVRDHHIVMTELRKDIEAMKDGKNGRSR